MVIPVAAFVESSAEVSRSLNGRRARSEVILAGCLQWNEQATLTILQVHEGYRKPDPIRNHAKPTRVAREAGRNITKKQ